MLTNVVVVFLRFSLPVWISLLSLVLYFYHMLFFILLYLVIYIALQKKECYSLCIKIMPINNNK